MKKMFTGVLAFLSLFTLTTSASFAGNQPGKLSVTVGAGELFLSSKRQMNNTGMPFIILGYDFTTKWGFEALLGSFNTTFDSSSPPHSSKQINGTLFSLNGVYRFGSYYQYIEPYVLAGIGVLGVNPNGNDANNEANINAAIGAQVFVDEIIAFRFEARDLYTFVGGKNDVLLSAGVSFLVNFC